MSRKGDNIYKRKDGCRKAHCRCDVSFEGRATHRSVRTYTFTEYQDKADKLNQEKSHTKRETSTERFGNLLERWLESNRIKVKASTENKYRYMVELHIKPLLGDYEISQLSTQIINDFLSTKLSGDNNTKQLSPSYVRTIAIIINSALKFASDAGIYEKTKCVINKPQVPKRELQILTLEEQNKYEEIFKEDNSLVALGSLIAIHTGMRIGEICALQWSDVNLSENLIYVRHTVTRIKNDDNTTKTKLIIDSPKTISSARVIPVSSALQPLLSEAYKNRVSDFVVSNKKTCIDTRTFDYKYRKILTSKGMKPVCFHTLRHTFATRCVESGVDIKSLSEILGHSSVSITMDIYVHSSLDNKRNQLEKLYVNK